MIELGLEVNSLIDALDIEQLPIILFYLLQVINLWDNYFHIQMAG
jgi:hypothetical protein